MTTFVAPEKRVLLDPTAERVPTHRERALRTGTLEGVTVALLDISKARGDVFLDRLEQIFTARGVATMRYRKRTFAKPLPSQMAHDIRATCGAVVEALAD